MLTAMRGYVELMRPLNCCIAAAAILAGAVVAVGFAALGGSAWQVAVAVVVGALFTGAGNALNDYYDRHVDEMNHPARPIPSGRVSAPRALKFAAVLFVIALVLGILAGWLALLVVIINLAAMISYELHFKRKGSSGNVIIGWLVASLFIFGGAAAFNGSAQALSRVSWMGLLAFLATVGREILKDIEDVAGDIDRRTLPMVIGVEKAGFLAATAFVLSVALSPLPFFTNVLGMPYLAVVTLADVIFIYCAWISTANPTLASRAAKYGMVVALFAFLAGGAP